jgi:hypothetical protein
MQSWFGPFPVASLTTALMLLLGAPSALANIKTLSSAHVSFASDRTEIAPGESVRLSWASINARHCFASGDWSGRVTTEGTRTIGPLDGDQTYTLECKTGSNTATQTVHVTVTPPPAPPPPPTAEPAPEPIEEAPPPPPPATLTLHASAAELRSGQSATLTWSGTSVENCRASGAWSGARPASGSETIGPLTADVSFTLTCQSASGNLVSMTSVLVTDGGTTLAWQPPT